MPYVVNDGKKPSPVVRDVRKAPGLSKWLTDYLAFGDWSCAFLSGFPVDFYYPIEHRRERRSEKVCLQHDQPTGQSS